MDLSAADIVDATPIPMILIGPDERISHVNAPARRLVGAATVGRHYVTALRAPAVIECIEAVLSGAEDTAIDRMMTTEASREVFWQITAAAVGTGSGRGALVSFLDATAVQEAGQIRRDFVANVSHELRTPLTALLGFIETLQGPARADPAAAERFLGIMQREAERMNRLIHDLLSLSRVEAEERMRPTEAVDLAAVIRSVVQSLRPMAQDAGVAIGEEGLAEPRIVPGDADQLAQVFTNLVENAIKYGGSGARVEVRLAEPATDPVLRVNTVTATVTDDGEGIDPVHLPRLTERFYRVDSHRSRQKGGTGLGLAIVKHIVNRHRGRLGVESAPGQGASFRVTLPVI